MSLRTLERDASSATLTSATEDSTTLFFKSPSFSAATLATAKMI